MRAFAIQHLERAARPRAPTWRVQLSFRIGVCVAVILAAAGAFAWTGRDPFVTEPWLAADPPVLVAISAAWGIALAAIVVMFTRRAVTAFPWGAEWAKDLRSDLRGASDGRLFLAAVTAGVAEELFFRGLLSTTIGIVASAIVFGAVHQLRVKGGPARWAWMASATALGLALALVFHATGSLLGPIVGHVLVNFANTRFLRDAPPERRPRDLGGLLRAR